jgi:hypothetical protein
MIPDSYNMQVPAYKLSPSERVCNWFHEHPDITKALRLASLISSISLLILIPTTSVFFGSSPLMRLAVSSGVSLISYIALSYFKASSPIPIDKPTSSVHQPNNTIYENPLSKLLRTFNDTSCNGDLGGVYITSNETGLFSTQKILLERPLPSNSCHVGFSGLHNFDIMAIRKSNYGLICDFNPHNKVLIEEALRLLRSTLDRQDFVNQMVLFINERNEEARTLHENGLSQNAMKFYRNLDSFVCTEIDQIKNALIQEGSWLASDEAFQHIKMLAMEDKISAITLDIRKSEIFKKISELLHKKSISIDTLYLSNICNYMKGEDKSKYALSIHALLQPDSIVINCPRQKYPEGKYKEYHSLELHQKVYLGKFFITSEDPESLFCDEHLNQLSSYIMGIEPNSALQSKH